MMDAPSVVTDNPLRARSAQAGSSLVELMVGLAIGMAVTAIVLTMAVLFDARRRSVAGTAEADIAASLAMLSMGREIRMAGSGLGPPEALRCDLTLAAAGGTATGPRFPLWPLTIVNGAGGQPDSVLLLASGKPESLPAARLLAGFSPGVTQLSVNSTFGIVPGDWLLLQQAGIAPCLLLRARSVSVGSFQVELEPLPPLPAPVPAYATGSVLANLGALRRQRFSLDGRGTLLQASHDILTDRWLDGSLAEGIVNLQAQYGFDARTGPQAMPQVSFWSDDVIDADRNGVVGDRGDWLRLLSVRMAIVSRSAVRRQEDCPVAAPTWQAGGATGQLSAMTLSVGPGADALCFRYRVLQAEIPLRNLIWSDR